MAILRRGNKYWIDFTFNGSRCRRSSPDNSHAGAKIYEACLRRKLARGEEIAVNLNKKKDIIPTFGEFAKDWFEKYVKSNNKYSEILNKESLLRAHLNPYFGKKQLDKISNLDIESYKAAKLQAGQSRKSVNNHLIALNKCLKTAQDWEIIDKIPKVKLLKVAPQRFDYLSIEECETLLDHCNGVLKEMVMVAIKTGLRFGELIALRWQDIDFSGNLITVQNSIVRGEMGSPKSNKSRYIHLSSVLFQMLNVKAKKTGFIFSQNGIDPLNPTLCLGWLHEACNGAEMRRIGWHTLRHTFASHLAQKGIPIMAIKELLGHADIKTTMRYAHLSTSITENAIDIIDKDIGHNMVTVPVFEDRKTAIIIPV